MPGERLLGAGTDAGAGAGTSTVPLAVFVLAIAGTGAGVGTGTGTAHFCSTSLYLARLGCFSPQVLLCGFSDCICVGRGVKG